MTANDSGRSAWLPRLAASLGCAWFLLHNLFVIFGPERRVMEWLYDDTFYYLITAKHFSEQHLSSFDGVTLTNGYHPLWMWLCAILYHLRGRLDLTYVRSAMMLTFLITSAILIYSVRLAWKRQQNGLLWTLALAATSYSALNNGLTVMEWPLVLLCWFLLHSLLLRNAERPALNAAAALGAFSTGFAGSFSRTDFGLIPACYFAAAILLGLRGRGWNAARVSACSTAGAAAALPLIFLYNYRMTGVWLQSSAQVKRLVASLSGGFNPVPAIWQFLRVILYLPALDLDGVAKTKLLHRGLTILIVAAIFAGVLLVLQRKALRAAIVRPRQYTPFVELTIVSSILGILAYLILDGLNSQATYGWYTAPVTGFVILLTARIISKWAPNLRAGIVVPILLLNIAAAVLRGGNARSQMAEVDTGKILRAEHPGARLAGGDVGKPSFYNGGTMTNLDGLMNNEVIPYLANGRLECYVLQKRLEYLSDIGTVAAPIVDVERQRLGLPTMPWFTYFVPIYDANHEMLYRRTDFDAIRASGECSTSTSGSPVTLK